MTTAAKAGITADIVYQRAVAEHETVGAEELGNVYQEMLQRNERGKRKAQGSYYTPQEVAKWMSNFALQLGLNEVGPEPEQVMRINAIDPCCGAGVFLVMGARTLAYAYASRLVGGEPSGDLMLAVIPRVILECVFGMDIDPVAVDLAKLALSLETAGALTPAMLHRHVICGNPLEGASPPALDDRTGGPNLREYVEAGR